MIDRDTLLALVQDELGIKHMYDAKCFRGGRFRYFEDWSVASIIEKKDRFDVSIWHTAKDYRRKRRPKPNLRVFVNFFGEFIDAPVTGRPAKDTSKSLIPLYVSVYRWMYPLARKLPTFYYMEPVKFYRNLLYASLCKHALRAERKDEYIFCRRVPGRKWDECWVVFDKHEQPLIQKGHKSEWAAWKHAYHLLVMKEDIMLLDN
mgnify:FL=1|tara:strand:- start:484 stop:1095 length:612 start_codon:yes stop_codon:yes gene_type:complete